MYGDEKTVHHDESGIEKAVNDLMGVSPGNRGYYETTSTNEDGTVTRGTGNTPEAAKADHDRQKK